MPLPPRGIRNNNPGNIRLGLAWQGRADVQTDPDFVIFKAPEWGLRALARVLLTYQSEHGLNTLNAIIGRWAPPGDRNDTPAYIAAVAADMGDLNPAEPINVDSVAVMGPLMKGIIRHENLGQQPYSDAQIMEGMRQAGVSDAKAKPLASSTSFVTTAAGAGGTVLAAASTAAEPVRKLADGLQPFAGVPAIQKAITAIMIVAAVLTTCGAVALWLKHQAQA